jgi:uroporphyrinogen III methyltransferase/synthase
MTGHVALVGAGPGDPGLLTVRALELIAAADAILYDRLAPAAALEGARPDAELVYVGKEPGRPAMAQEEINSRLVELGREGKRVVRLKGGDPFVFGRGAEEAAALREAELSYEVVPGVTAGIAAPAYAGIPVTHRDAASAVAFVTGHEDPDKPESALDWDALARFPGTLVLYMGVGRLATIARGLIAAGRPADEPAAVVERGTLAGQRTVVATLATIADRAAEEGIKPPAVTVVGAVAAERERLAWLEDRPLHGRTVAVTRARAQASELAARLRALGAEVVEAPAIRIEPLPVDPPDLDAYDLVCLTSPNGVRLLFERIAGDARAFAGKTVAAIGPGTARALRERGIEPDVVPERSVAESLLEALADVPATRALVARAAEARDVLPEGCASGESRSTSWPSTRRWPSRSTTRHSPPPGTPTSSRSRPPPPSASFSTRLGASGPAAGSSRSVRSPAPRCASTGSSPTSRRPSTTSTVWCGRCCHTRRDECEAGRAPRHARRAAPRRRAGDRADAGLQPRRARRREDARGGRFRERGPNGQGSRRRPQVPHRPRDRVGHRPVPQRLAVPPEQRQGGQHRRHRTAGVTLEDVPESNDFRGGYQFTAPRAGSVTFTVTWIQQLQAQSGDSAGECTATATITLPVFALKQARVSLVRYVRHRVVRVTGGFAVSDDLFQLAVTPAAEPIDPAPVYVVLRVRRGLARAPSATGRVFRRVRLNSLHTIRGAGLSVDDLAVEGPNDTFRPGLTVGLDPFVQQGRTVRFGFSIEIVQGGRRLGGMRSGAICRIAFSSRANRHYRKCAPIGFAKHP